MSVIVLGLLLSSIQVAPQPAMLAKLEVDECPQPSFDKELGYLGNRAIIAEDGSKLVVQCGDGLVHKWEAGTDRFRAVGNVTLFRAAQSESILPADLICPWSSRISAVMKQVSDCDVLDSDRARGTFVLQTPSSPDRFVVAGRTVLLESSVWQRFGALSSENGGAGTLYLVDGSSAPELLQQRSLTRGPPKTIARLPNPSMLVEEGEGRAFDVLYSPAYRTILVSFAGEFRIAENMTVLRAFEQNGQERWHIRVPLPKRDESLIVGDGLSTRLILDGRVLVATRHSDQYRTQLVDVRDGRSIATVEGRLIAAARTAPILLLRHQDGSIFLANVQALVGGSAEQ